MKGWVSVSAVDERVCQCDSRKVGVSTLINERACEFSVSKGVQYIVLDMWVEVVLKVCCLCCALVPYY